MEPFANFRDFVESIQRNEEAAPQLDAKVGSPEEFEKMRKHLLSVYSGLDVPHSFVDEAGQVFDCVPIEQQPSARGSAIPVNEAPPELPGSSSNAGLEAANVVESVAGEKPKDPFGNARVCPAGTIPMRRITPEELARFETLEQFFQKGPAGRGQIPPVVTLEESIAAPQVAVTHKYAHAAQTVNNVGGHSIMSVWSPPVSGDQFSLSQHWYVANGASGVQTAEVGWQIYPQKYGHAQPVLFVYWTADGYRSTGSYNMDKGEFVQTNPAWTLGGVLSPWSAIGGPIREIEVAYFLSGAKWWLYLNGSAVGYFPASHYRGGPMATGASRIDYGGETVGSVSWPAMGSGRFADAGAQQAASHRDIYYYTPGSNTPVLANLTAQQLSPLCYTISLGSAAPPWNKYFFYGGQGGTNC